MNPITDITVLVNDAPTPQDYIKIPVDLNNRAHGDTLYLCYTRRKSGLPITKIQSITPQLLKPPQPPPGFKLVNVDLNKGIPSLGGSNSIYLCFAQDNAVPYYDLVVQMSDKIENILTPNGYERVTFDLNRGVHGDYIVLAASKVKPIKVPEWPGDLSYNYIKQMGGFSVPTEGPEYEIERTQIGENSWAIHSILLSRMELGTYPGSHTYQYRKYTSSTEINSYSSVIHVSAGGSYLGIQASIDAVFKESYYSKFIVEEEELDTFTINFPPNDPAKTYLFFQIIERATIRAINNFRELVKMENRWPSYRIIRLDENKMPILEGIEKEQYDEEVSEEERKTGKFKRAPYGGLKEKPTDIKKSFKDLIKKKPK